MKKAMKILKYGLFFLVLGIASCNNEDTVVDTKPVAAFTLKEIKLTDNGQAVSSSFTDASFDQNGNVASWNWNFGDGTSSMEQSPTHIYAPGKYKVVLTVTDNSGNVNVNQFSKELDLTAILEPVKLWEFTLPGIVESVAAGIGDDGTIYMPCSSAKGTDNMFAINPNGTKKWSYATGDINRSAASIDANGIIYVGSYDKYLYGFSPNGGTPPFKYNVANTLRYEGAVFAADGTIYVGAQQSFELFALNPNGTLKWKYKTGNALNATPAIGLDGTIYVGSTDGFFYALNPNGTLKWKSKYGSYTACATAIGSDGTIYFSGEVNDKGPLILGVAIAYNPDGTEKWRKDRAGKVARGGFVIAPDGTLYLGGEDSKLIAYNPNDGSIKWEYATKGPIRGCAAIDNDGNIYVGDNSGYLHVIDPQGNKKWKEKKLGASMWSSVIIGKDGVIYAAATQVNNTSAVLYALKTNATGPASTGWPMQSRDAKHSGR